MGFTEYGEHVLNNITTVYGERVFSSNLTSLGKHVFAIIPVILQSFTENVKITSTSLAITLYKLVYHSIIRLSYSILNTLYSILYHIPMKFVEIMKKRFVSKKYDTFKQSDFIKKIFTLKRFDRLKQIELFKTRLWSFVRWMTEYGETILNTVATEIGEHFYNSLTALGKHVLLPRLSAVFIENIIFNAFMKISSIIKRFENIRLSYRLTLFTYTILYYIPFKVSETIRKSLLMKLFEEPNIVETFAVKFTKIFPIEKIGFALILFYHRMWQYIYRLTEYGEHVLNTIQTFLGEHVIREKVTSAGILVIIRLKLAALFETVYFTDVVDRIWNGYRKLYDVIRPSETISNIIIWLKRRLYDFMKPYDVIRRFGSFKRYAYEIIRFSDVIYRGTSSFKRILYDNMKVNMMLERISYTIRRLSDYMKYSVLSRLHVMKSFGEFTKVIDRYNVGFRKMFYERISAFSEIVFSFKKKLYDTPKFAEMIRKNVVKKIFDVVKPTIVFFYGSLYRLYRFIFYDYMQISDYIQQTIMRYVKNLYDTIKPSYSLVVSFYHIVYHVSFRIRDTIIKSFIKKFYDSMKSLDMLRKRFVPKFTEIVSTSSIVQIISHYLEQFLEEMIISMKEMIRVSKKLYETAHVTDAMKRMFRKIVSDIIILSETLLKRIHYRIMFVNVLKVNDFILKYMMIIYDYIRVVEKFVPFAYVELEMIIVGAGKLMFSFKKIVSNVFEIISQSSVSMKIRKAVERVYEILKETYRKYVLKLNESN